MTYLPRIGDAAIDLARCLSASYGEKGFRSRNFLNFYNNSLLILDREKDKISANRLKLIKSRIVRAGNDGLDSEKRREDLLLASNLLLKEHVRSLQVDNLRV